jgi:hypothetical protein
LINFTRIYTFSFLFLLLLKISEQRKNCSIVLNAICYKCVKNNNQQLASSCHTHKQKTIIKAVCKYQLVCCQYIPNLHIFFFLSVQINYKYMSSTIWSLLCKTGLVLDKLNYKIIFSFYWFNLKMSPFMWQQYESQSGHHTKKLSQPLDEVSHIFYFLQDINLKVKLWQLDCLLSAFAIHRTGIQPVNW